MHFNLFAAEGLVIIFFTLEILRAKLSPDATLSAPLLLPRSFPHVLLGGQRNANLMVLGGGTAKRLTGCATEEEILCLAFLRPGGCYSCVTMQRPFGIMTLSMQLMMGMGQMRVRVNRIIIISLTRRTTISIPVTIFLNLSSFAYKLSLQLHARDPFGSASSCGMVHLMDGVN